MSEVDTRLANRILAGLVVGAVAGGVVLAAAPAVPGLLDAARWFASNVADPVGQVFLRMLFFVVVPLVFASLANGVLQLGELAELGPLAGRTFTLIFLNMAIAAALGLMNATYSYRVAARNSVGTSTFSNTADVTVPAQPLPPSSFNAVNGPNSNKTRPVILSRLDTSNNETGFTIERATNSLFTLGLTSGTVPAGTTTYTATGLSRGTQYWFRIRSNNGTFVFSIRVNATPFPILTNP